MKRSCLALAVVLVASVRVAAAQVPSAADRETARALMDDGDRAFTERRFADALRAYREADGIMHVPTTGTEVAKAHEALGQLIEGKEACRRVLAHPREPTEPKPFTAARESCALLSQSLGDRIPSVTIRIAGVTASASPEMTIDGEAVVVASLELKRRVNPGEHRIILSAAGYDDATASFSVAERGNAHVDISLHASSSASKPHAPAAVDDPSAAASRADVPLYAKIALGAGGAGVLVGSVTGVMALLRVSSAKKLCIDSVCEPAASSDIEAAKSLSHVSTVGFAVGILGAGIGVVGILTRGNEDRPATMNAYFTGTGGGVAGRF